MVMLARPPTPPGVKRWEQYLGPSPNTWLPRNMNAAVDGTSTDTTLCRSTLMQAMRGRQHLMVRGIRVVGFTSRGEIPSYLPSRG